MANTRDTVGGMNSRLRRQQFSETANAPESGEGTHADGGVSWGIRKVACKDLKHGESDRLFDLGGMKGWAWGT